MTLPSLRWRLGAPCRSGDPRWWYPPLDAASPQPWYEKGRTVCQRCPVWETCLEAGKGEKFGMWAGLNPRERAGKKLFPHGYWVRYRQGCRCGKCTASHIESCTPRGDLAC